jgi:NAD(P)-dependent dehydrogenase (short-subunit alcohol dehydrogenase family)
MLFKGMTAFVAGATGEVGRVVAFVLSKAGADATIAGRSAEKLAAVHAILPGKSNSVELIISDDLHGNCVSLDIEHD